MSHPRSPHPTEQAESRRGERGNATIQIAILFPAMLLILLACLQAGVYWYCQSAALSAAQEGVRVTAANDGTVSAGTDRASSFLKRISGTLIESAQVTGRRTTTEASITVRGTALTLIPGVPFTITATATLPSEEYSR